MTAEIRIYIEGGGESKQTQTALRLGFDAFLKSIKDKARERGIRYQVIMCGGCDDAYQAYLLALKTHPDATNVLLVDSEGPVADSNGDHLRQRAWNLPQTQNPHYHLMVQAMEALFVADPDTLVEFYGKDFHRNALPKHANLEAVSVSQLADSLKVATRGTTKGEYRKIQHAAKLLPMLNLVRVRTALPHCDKLFTFLDSLFEPNH
ncbi:MAG: DUF4276 family protein [bacterium]